jgi:protein SCO1/2
MTLLILIGLVVMAWPYRPYTFKGMVMQSAQLAPNFTLTSAQTGQPVSLTDFRGKIVLLYFGYTYCPDVCPTTLADVTQTLKLLGQSKEQVQLLLITVDPERDTPPVLADYLTHFDPSFIGLVPQNPNETLTVATQYGIFYQKHEYGSKTGGYLMDHTATLTLIDPAGYIRVIYPFGSTANDIAADLSYVLGRWSAPF